MIVALCHHDLRLTRQLAWVVAWLGLVSWVPAAPLRELAPADAGLYVELHHLAADVEQFQSGELFVRWQRHPLWQLAQLKLQDRWRPVRDFLGLSNDHWWLQLLGDEALLAIWPGEHSGDPGTALILVRTREHELLSQVVRRAGEDAVRRDPQARRELTINGVTLSVFTLQTKRDPRPVQLTVLPGSGEQPSVGVMTSRREVFETIVRGALQTQRANASSNDRPTVRVTLQPRPWDALIHATPQPTEPRAQRGRQLIEESWQAIDSATLDVSLTNQIHSEVRVAWQSEKLPTMVNDLVAGLSGTTQLAARASDDALAIAGGRLDVGRFVRALMAAGPGEVSLIRWPSNFEFHLGLSTATALGPDWVGALVAARPEGAGDKPSWPIDWLVGVETRGLTAESDAKLGPVIVPLVQQALRFAETAELTRNPNSTARTETIEAEDRNLLRITGIPQTGPHDAIVLTENEGVIWAGSAVESLQHAGNAHDAKWFAPLKSVAGAKPSEISHFALVDLAGLRRVIESSPHGARRLAEVRKIDVEQAERDLQTMSRLLDVADRVLVTGRVASDGLNLRGEVTAEKP